MSAPSGEPVRSWIRRNRLALIFLPLVLVLVAVGTASRLDTYWWSKGFHEGSTPNAQGWIQLRDEFDDGYLTYPIEARIRLDGIKRIQVTDLPEDDQRDVELPDGGALWQVDTSWRADPDVSLVGCNLALVSSDGTRFDASSFGWNAGLLGFTDQCMPADRKGPRPTVGSAAQPAVPDDEEPRPAAWRKTSYVLTSDDAKPREVRIWYFLPRYASLPVR